MKLYSPEVKTPRRLTRAEERAAAKEGLPPEFHALLKHIFEGQPAAWREFGEQMQLRVRHPEKLWPIFTIVPFDRPGHEGCPCSNLLADMMAAIGVRVEVLHNVRAEDQNALRALAGQ
jgi:hypothetical protein